MSISCKISEEIISKAKKFRFAKNLGDCAYLCFKINRSKFEIELEEEELDTDFETIAEELPEDSPRFLLVSYKQPLDDGRVKYPLVFIHYCPPGVHPELNMLFTTSRNEFMKQTNMNRSLELNDKEELSKDWVDTNLQV